MTCPRLAALLALSLTGFALAGLPTDFMQITPDPAGGDRIALRMDRGAPAPRVAQVAAALRAQGRGRADPAMVARMLAGPTRQTGIQGGQRVLSFQYAPAGYPPYQPLPPPGRSSGGSAFMGLFMALLTMFLALSTGIFGMGTAQASTFPGALPPVPGYSQPANPWGTPTQLAPSSLTGGISPFGMPTVNAPPGGTATWNQGSPTNGQSFFRSLPLPQGSWKVGPNGHFWDCRASCGRPHHGNDLHATAGTPVFAVADGVVKQVKYDSGGYHWYIILQHDARSSTGRQYNTLYGHIEVGAGIAVGARVRAGQQIATVSAKKVQSPHCHFEVLVDDGGWKGQPVDPNAFANFHAPGEAGTRYAGRSPPLGTTMV